MIKLSIILGLLFSFTSFADSVKVTLNTKSPVIGEEVELKFNINTQSTAEPDITFTPYNAEVLGKSNGGLSIRTTVINGKITTERTMTYVYRLVIPKQGTFRINEIEVDIEGKTYKHPNIVGNALREALRPKSVFALAIPSKTTVYKGEGITVDYYLYFKIPVRGVEIEKFPKLNTFIKRFQQPKENIETIEYKGEVFRRVKKYSARIYPQKTGKLYIDPISLRVAYQARSRGFDPFGMSSMRTKTVHSKKIEIFVNELPSINVPSDFIGLIGKHEVKFSLSASKFLVNEAIEAKLTVKGPGELENLAPFKIYENKFLESFDIKENLSELPGGIAQKDFDYTFLGRRNVEIPEHEYTFSYFNPDTMSYERDAIKLPALSIKGVAAKSQYSNGSDTSEPLQSNVHQSTVNNGVATTFVAPLFLSEGQRAFTQFFPYIKYLLFVLILIVIIMLTRKVIAGGILDRDDEFSLAYKKAMKQQNYESLYGLLAFFTEKEGEGVIKALERLQVAKEVTEYFSDLLMSYELSKYSDSKKSSKLKISSKNFKVIYKRFYEQK